MAPWCIAYTRLDSPATLSNACRGGRSRFAPIHDARGECVPSLYAATSLPAAIFETLFHDVPLEARRKTIPRSSVEARQHTVLQLRRDLRLASLRAPALLKWRVASALVWGPPKQYVTTARWAKAVHDQFEDVEGLIWTSRRCDPDSGSVVLRWPHDGSRPPSRQRPRWDRRIVSFETCARLGSKREWCLPNKHSWQVSMASVPNRSPGLWVSRTRSPVGLRPGRAFVCRRVSEPNDSARCSLLSRR